MDEIIIRGARHHNLKNITLSMPRNKFVVITGVSGSGKSTLAFDTLYAEGQRRYIESLSSYARQFLGVMDKPDVDSIDGLSPAISIEQKSTIRNPRSTVGTTTEIFDYLRLLYARVGRRHCPKCGDLVVPQTTDMIIDSIMRMAGTTVMLFAPLVREQKGTHQKLIADLGRDGFTRAIINGELRYTDDVITLDKNKKHTIWAIIDEFVVDDRQRVADSVQTALNLAGGYVIVRSEDKGIKSERLFANHASCPRCEISIETLEPRHFSFNSPLGACETCAGLGVQLAFDQELVVPDPDKSVLEILAPVSKRIHHRFMDVAALGRDMNFTPLSTFSSLTELQQKALLKGTDEPKVLAWLEKNRGNKYMYFEGIMPMLQRVYRMTESELRRVELEHFMRSVPCDTCKGMKLKSQAIAVRIGDENIIGATERPISEALQFFGNLSLSETEHFIAGQVLREITSRLTFLEQVGLGYLSLSRSMETLSGGEAQRIRLATQIGANLMGVMYVLDEPSIGLHQRDNARLITTLKHLRDIGNTVIVVEHDEDTMLACDYIIDIGPGAGIHGGHVVAAGTPQEVMATPESLTGQFLSGAVAVAVPVARRQGRGLIEIRGAREHNLKNISVNIPTGVLTCVTGVSGSGKSTLINDILARQLSFELYGSRERPGKHDEIVHTMRDLVVIDQSPIGRTPRSNPATYTKLFDNIRSLFAETKEARARGYQEGRFSFNVTGGRCEKCSGDGTIKIEMNFLPDVYVTCEACKGARYNQETLQVLYKGHTISQVLNMNVDEALEFFESVPPLRRKLKTLQDVGLGYIKLGQSATTFSGGEAQRIKLSRELSKMSHERTLYILDEPTTGLHFEDVRKLLGVLNALVNNGATVVVIEHNLDVIKSADYVIDLGPEGGAGGGTLVSTGTPEQIAKCEESYTGQFLQKVLRTS